MEWHEPIRTHLASHVGSKSQEMLRVCDLAEPKQRTLTQSLWRNGEWVRESCRRIDQKKRKREESRAREHAVTRIRWKASWVVERSS